MGMIANENKKQSSKDLRIRPKYKVECLLLLTDRCYGLLHRQQLNKEQSTGPLISH